MSEFIYLPYFFLKSVVQIKIYLLRTFTFKIYNLI